MSVFTISNVRSGEVTRIEGGPWDIRAAEPPEGMSKDEYKAFCASPGTDSAFFSGVQGRVPGLRVSAKSGNPPEFVHGIAADYDCSVPDIQYVLAIAARKKHKPSGICVTRSGNLRAWWPLAEPVRVDDMETAREFLKVAGKRMGVNQFFPEMDSKTLDPVQYQFAGGQWTLVPGAVPLGRDISLECLRKAITNTKPKAGVETDIPWGAVVAEVESRWPSMAGRVREGGQCDFFWDPTLDGQNPAACTLHPWGVFVFSDRGRPGRVSWKEILGAEFTSTFETKRLAGLMDKIYVDPKTFWMAKRDGSWIHHCKSDLVTRLKARGLSDERDRKMGETASEIDRFLDDVWEENSVNGAGPFHYNNDRIVRGESMRFLNTSIAKVCWEGVEPDGSLVPEEAFPFSWSILRGIWDPVRSSNGVLPADYFIEYLRRTVVQIRAGRGLGFAQAIFIQGVPGSGKSFMIRKIVSPLFGSVAVNAAPFFEGGRFNGDLAISPLWLVDDDDATSMTQAQRASIRGKIKSTISNGSIRFEDKGLCGVNIPANPRVIVAANTDIASDSLIPALDESTEDKFSFLRTLGPDVFDPGFVEDRDVNEARARAEIPALASWLLGKKPMEGVVPSKRWGMEAYHNPDMVTDASDKSHGGTTRDDVAAAVGRHFLGHDATAPSILVPASEIQEHAERGVGRPGIRGVPASIGPILVARMLKEEAKRQAAMAARQQSDGAWVRFVKRRNGNFYEFIREHMPEEAGIMAAPTAEPF